MELRGRWSMAGTSHLQGLLVTGVLAVLLALPVAGTARAGNGHEPMLRLDPASGPPGSRVTAVVSDFGRCLPVESPPSTTTPPPSVASSGLDGPVVAPAAMGVAGGIVEFLWDGSKVIAEATDSGSGAVSAEFSVPGEATLGVHRVVARCPGTDWLHASASFELTRTKASVIVPSVIGMDREEAEKTLIRARLSVGRVSGQGDRVTAQSPGIGVEAEPGSPVDIDLGPVKPKPPRTATVPKLIGRNVDKIPALLRARGLVLGQVVGKGEIVRDQRPGPGSRVPVGSAVGVSTQERVDAPVMIRVPNVVGRKVSTARLDLAAVKLKLGGSPHNDRRVATQRPPAGTFVTAGSLVTVTLAPIQLVAVPDLVGSGVASARAALSTVGLVLADPLTSDRVIASQQPAAGTMVSTGTAVTVTFRQPFSLASAAGLLAVLSGTAAVAARLVRQRLDRRWVRRMVSVVAAPAPVSVPTITETGASSGTPVVRLELHYDHGTHVLERSDS